MLLHPDAEAFFHPDDDRKGVPNGMDFCRELKQPYPPRFLTCALC